MKLDYDLPADLTARVLSPALILYVDAVRENLRRMLRYAGDDPERWRPHVKTTKVPRILRELAAAGIRNFKCATTREAETLLAVLRDEGVENADVLLAYPLVGPALGRLARIAASYPEARVSLLCEDEAVLATVPASLSVFIDVNPGMNRTGMPNRPRSRIRSLARACGERFRGIHFYEGHLHDGELEERRAAAFAGYEDLLELVEYMSDEGIRAGELITSGTPSFLSALAYPRFRDVGGGTIHRISPGTVVYHDLRSEEDNPDLDLVPAALVYTRVVSHPAADIVTCDAGSKSIAAEAGDPCARVLGRSELLPLVPSEEHLPLRVLSGELPVRGEELLLFARHICPTINLAESALLIEEGAEPRVVPVSARAHELLAAEL